MLKEEKQTLGSLHSTWHTVSKQVAALVEIISLWVANPKWSSSHDPSCSPRATPFSPRTSYVICGAQCKKKIWWPLFKNYSEF